MEDIVSLDEERINIIVAFTSENRFIGYNKDLPWKRKLKGDKQFLKNIIIPSEGSKILVIMGRVTYETCPKIKNGQVGVITSSSLPSAEVLCFKTFDSAVEFGRSNNFIIVVFGGESIYKEALNYDHKLFCTIVQDSSLPGDRRFPHCETPMSNRTLEVEQYLLSKGIEKTWEVEKNQFLEDGLVYGFYIGESVK